MKTYIGSRVPPPHFLRSALDGAEGSLLLLGCFAPKEEPWVGGPQGHLDIFEEEKNLLPL